MNGLQRLDGLANAAALRPPPRRHNARRLRSFGQSDGEQVPGESPSFVSWPVSQPRPTPSPSFPQARTEAAEAAELMVR